MSPAKTLIAAAALALLAACGKMGQLERPGPMFGAARPAPAAAAEAPPEDPSRTVRTIDPRDRNADPAPPRTVPLESAPNTNLPGGVAPPGGLRDPYADPRR